MCGPHTAYAPISLPVCYAMCGTDIAYAVLSPYAMCGTDIAYAVLSPYAMCGTDITYAATSALLYRPLSLCPCSAPSHRD
eukprot:2731854-Rhodomonas_salina.1